MINSYELPIFILLHLKKINAKTNELYKDSMSSNKTITLVGYFLKIKKILSKNPLNV